MSATVKFKRDAQTKALLAGDSAGLAAYKAKRNQTASLKEALEAINRLDKRIAVLERLAGITKG